MELLQLRTEALQTLMEVLQARIPLPNIWKFGELGKSSVARFAGLGESWGT